MNNCCNVLILNLAIILEIIILGFILNKPWEVVFLIIAQVIIFAVIVDRNYQSPIDNLENLTEISSVNNITYVDIEEGELNNFDFCPICLDDDHENVIKLSCNHFFHKHCIDRWVSNNSSCPVCRLKLIC